MGELIFEGILLLFFILMFINGLDIEIYNKQTMARYWPEAVLAIIIGLLIISAVQKYRKLNKAEKTKRSFIEFCKDKNTLKVLLAFLLLIAYAVLITYTGFLPASWLIGCCYAWLLGEKRWLRSIWINLAIVLVLFLIFHSGLGILMPRGQGIFKTFGLFMERIL